MLLLKSQRGFSLIEVIVGMVVLSIIVTAVLTVSLGDKGNFKDRASTNISCKTEAQRIMGNFKNKGLMRSYYSLPLGGGVALPAPGTNLLPPGAPVPATTPTSASELGIEPTERWNVAGGGGLNNNAIITYGNPATATPAILRPYTLIMGVITALETLHNNYPAVCGSTGLSSTSATGELVKIFSALGGLEVNTDDSNGLRLPDAFLLIRMYNSSTGALISPNPCGGDHEHVAMPRNGAAPTSLNSTPVGLTAANHPNPSLPANVGSRVGRLHSPSATALRFDAGYEVTIRVEYDNRSGTRENCSVTERFQYPLIASDVVPPLDLQDYKPAELPPVDSDFPEQMNSFLSSGGALQYANNNDMPPPNCSSLLVDRSVNLRVTNARPGSIFMCRNLSTQRLRAIPGVVTVGGPTGTLTGITIWPAAGIRQSFYSTELTKSISSFGFDNGLLADATANAQGFIHFNSLYYPTGSYFCDSLDGCQGLPRFDNSGTLFTSATTNHYDFYSPSNHSSQNTVAWNATDRRGRWLPCENTAVVCAQNDTTDSLQAYLPTAGFVAGSTTAADAYVLQYQGLPTGCEVHIQVAEVDASYNIRATEIYEYTHERIPGDRLCHNAGDPVDTWHFACSTTVSSPFLALPNCTTLTARNDGIPGLAARYDTSTSCCIDYPGTPTAVPIAPNGHQNGVWHSNPSTTEAY